MLANAYGIFICVAGVAGMIWILYVMRDGDKDRHDEDDARSFFDEHGHWPDQTPEEAEAERVRLAAASAAAGSAPVSHASPDGLV
ncbi:MAG TPA: hypothetical protein VFG42_16810 [Baekduia sp.]|uniref:hypothetical protein n=1 Tax=Baekduia sp. TaxID=2600305 RepID=UPI002D783F29|nr:hypothetical protein [Baekduia sp.]HET6508458.1 hypothetical protein [Baekduia sp.]